MAYAFLHALDKNAIQVHLMAQIPISPFLANLSSSICQSFDNIKHVIPSEEYSGHDGSK